MNSNNFKIEQDIFYHNSRERIFRIIYIEKGNTKVTIDFHHYEITGPALVFISENQLLDIQKTSTVLEGKVVCFSNDFFCIKLNRSETFCDAVIFNTTKPPYIPLEASEKRKVEYLITAMENELEEANDFQEEIIISQLKTLLLSSSKIKLKQFGQVNLSMLSLLVTDFQNLLDKAYESQHNVQYYADSLNISQ